MTFFSSDTIDQIRRGYFSAVYFNRTKELLLAKKNLTYVTMQVFQKREGSTLCGIDEVVELFRVGVGYWDKEKWIEQFSAKKVVEGFKYNSNTNTDWLSLEQMRQLIKKHVVENLTQ